MTASYITGLVFTYRGSIVVVYCCKKEEGCVFLFGFSNKEFSSGREAVLSQTACFLSFILRSSLTTTYNDPDSDIKSVVD